MIANDERKESQINMLNHGQSSYAINKNPTLSYSEQ